MRRFLRAMEDFEDGPAGGPVAVLTLVLWFWLGLAGLPLLVAALQ